MGPAGDYGSNPTDLSSTYNYTTRFSGRHTGAGDLVFGDGHAAGYKYPYVCIPLNGQPADPGRPNINLASRSLRALLWYSLGKHQFDAERVGRMV